MRQLHLPEPLGPFDHHKSTLGVKLPLTFPDSQTPPAVAATQQGSAGERVAPSPTPNKERGKGEGLGTPEPERAEAEKAEELKRKWWKQQCVEVVV